jgi:hypothetical protein
MSKKLFIISLVTFSFMGWDGSALDKENKQSTPGEGTKNRAQTKGDCRKNISVYMDTWCPLRVRYTDCDGKKQANVIRFKGFEYYNVLADTKIAFECESGTAPTQELDIPYGHLTCRGGAWGANLICSDAP